MANVGTRCRDIARGVLPGAPEAARLARKVDDHERDGECAAIECEITMVSRASLMLKIVRGDDSKQWNNKEQCESYL